MNDKSVIPAHGTRPERVLHDALRIAGLPGLRCQAADLPGSPDVVSDELRVAGFAHGCWWHHHDGCSCARLPQRNCEWWRSKFRRNRERDARAVRSLKSAGWRVIIVWECATLDCSAQEIAAGIRAALEADYFGSIEFWSGRRKPPVCS